MSIGADQSERFPAALASDWFHVDETTATQLVAMSRRFASALKFVGEDGQAHGDWGRLLDGDETALLARLLSLRLGLREREFLDDSVAARPDRLAGHLLDLSRGLDRWFDDLDRINGPRTRAFKARVEQLITQSMAVEFGSDGPAGVRRAADYVARQVERMLRQGPGADNDTWSLQRLRRVYFMLLKAIARIQALAADEWRASLESETHEPAAALLLTFVQMFGRVQERLNGFTERLTDFYYHDVLRMGPRPAQPDSVHLVFGRDPAFPGPVQVPAGSRFVVGRLGTAAFVADRGLTVTDMRVVALRTLRLQRDPLISPEREFGYVTRVKVDAVGAEVGLGSDLRESAPLMGADARGGTQKGENARIGLLICSPVLWLKEGEREVRLTINFDLGGEKIEDLLERRLGALEETAKAAQAERFGTPERAAKVAEVCKLLGRLFALWVLPDSNVLKGEDRRRIRAALAGLQEMPTFNAAPDQPRDETFEAESVSPTDPMFLFLGPDRADVGIEDLPGDAAEADRERSRRNLVRDELVENMFRLALSTADGWCEIPRVVVAEPTDASRDAMTLSLHLGNEDPSIEACSPLVHGPDFPTEAPVLRLMINDQAPLFPLSLLDGAILDAIDIAVSVEGLRDLRAYNQLGPVDPSRPFMPFGPLPDTASHLVIGAPELSRKYVTSLSVAPEWAGLPPGGFADHYAAYGLRIRDASFTAAAFILRDGLWFECGAAPEPLFSDDEQMGLRPLPIVFDGAALAARWRPTDANLVLDQTARNGFVRVQIAGPPEAFGHQAYPGLLTDVLSARARGRKRPRPNPPYTPVLERVTLSYSASTRIEIGRTGAAPGAQKAERVAYLHPFGVEQIYPAWTERRRALMPAFGRDGHLFIGLSGSDVQGVLTLLFDLQTDADVDAEARRREPPIIEWSWLGDDQWQRLEQRRILSDTTSGFRTSGVIALDLPAGLTRGNRRMPGNDLVWLRVSSDAAAGCFAGLKGVKAQTLSATRALSATPPDEPLPAGSISLTSAAFPGVLAIDQPEAGFGLRRAETQAEERTRIGERLRHKNRASTPWDYERLVLERFPDVYKVRCLANRADRTGAHAPGHVLVVVAPAAPRNDIRYATRAMRLDPLELDRIQEHLQARASPFAKLTVRNASYDLIQVRCKVWLHPGADTGDTLRRINEAILVHLSPWHDGGAVTGFDWEVRGEGIEDCVRRFDEVESVTGISFVHVWEEQVADEPTYRFVDTAAPLALGPQAEVVTMARRRHPWSFALPAAEHFIEVARDDDARPTGVARTGAGLQIGSTFVVGAASTTRRSSILVEDYTDPEVRRRRQLVEGDAQ